MEMCFHTVFGKYVNPICGSIAQLIQEGLLTNAVMDPFSKKMFFPENVMNIIYRAIEVYKEDKKTKDEIESFHDNLNNLILFNSFIYLAFKKCVLKKQLLSDIRFIKRNVFTQF